MSPLPVRIALVLVFITTILMSPAVASACTPPPPEPWFYQVLTIDTAALPPGITLEPVLRIVNSSKSIQIIRLVSERIPEACCRLFRGVLALARRAQEP